MAKQYTKDMIKRDERIVYGWVPRGWTNQRIANREGISVPRVVQIKRAYGIQRKMTKRASR